MEARDFNEQVARAYSLGARGYAMSWQGPHPWMQEEREEFARYLTPGATLLDIGCGPGRDSAYWHAKGFQVTGVDASEEMIKVSREAYSGIDFRVLSFAQLRQLGHTYDAGWASFSLLHVHPDELRVAVENLASVLRHEAPLFIATGVREHSELIVSTIAGLKADDGSEITAPSERWEEREFMKFFEDHFVLRWRKLDSPLEGRDSILNMVLQRK